MTRRMLPDSSTARVLLSNSSVLEDAQIGDLVGTLSVTNGSGSYTFSIAADPDGKFALDGDDLEVDAALDYGTATSHQVTIEADNGVDDPISRSFTISVTEVSGGVAITLDQFQAGRTFQRTVNGDGSFESTGPVAISGSTTGQASAIEARVLLEADDSVVVDWTTIDATPAADSFAGTLAVPQGGPYYVEVRDAVATSIGDVGSTTFKVGLVAIGLSQSNMGGMYATQSSPPAADPLTGWFDHNTDQRWEAEVPGNGMRELMNSFVDITGVPIAVGNPARSGVGCYYYLDGADGWEGVGDPGDVDYQVGIPRLIEWMGGDVEIIFFRGGEGEANAVGSPETKKATLKTDLMAVRDQIETYLGHPVTIIAASIGTTTVVGGGTTDEAWSAMDAAIYELAQEEDRFILSASAKDGQRVDEYHPDAMSHGLVGQRFAQSLAVYNGDESVHPAWYIVSAAIVDATHTRLTLAHSMGDDFTPSADITDFEVTGNGGGTWLDCIGAREDATHIVLTHTTIATTADRSVRYQHGMVLTFDPGDATLKNPVLDGMVSDNSALQSPLHPSSGRVITAPGSAGAPVNTYVTSIKASTSTEVQQITVDLGDFDVNTLVVLRGMTSASTFHPGYDTRPSSITLTPDGGSPIACTIITQRSTTGGPMPFIAQVLVPAGTPGMDAAVLTITAPQNPFGYWTVAFNKITGLSSITTTDFAYTEPGNTDTLSVAVDALTDGIVLGVADTLGAFAADWTESSEAFAERYELFDDGALKCSADAVASADGAVTVQVDFPAAGDAAMAVASWR